MYVSIAQKSKVGGQLLDVAADHAAWSEQTFGSTETRGPAGPLKHLAKEAKEAVKAIAESPARLRSEIADCQLLVMDAARRAGMSMADLLHECAMKMEENKRREWPANPSPDAPVEHVREEAAADPQPATTGDVPAVNQ